MAFFYPMIYPQPLHIPDKPNQFQSLSYKQSNREGRDVTRYYIVQSDLRERYSLNKQDLYRNRCLILFVR